MTMVLSAPSAGRVDRRTAMLGAAVLVAALFVLCHPYIGLRGDAALYVTHALAELDTGGLRQDLMVVDDGQMRFSLFPLLLRPLVATLGAAQAAMLVAAIGSAAWLAALGWLAWRLAPGRTALAMMAMVAVLPLSYGDNNIFYFAETSATPRTPAEAAVMAALAALLAGRYVMAAVVLAFAAALHPIMAVAGFGVAALVLVWRLPVPWRIAAASAAVAAALLAVALALLGVAPFDRLIVCPDREWLYLLRLRSPHLFPTLWTSLSFPPLLAQTATILVAAHRVDGPRRHILIGALVVGLLGFAADMLLGDRLHLLLFIQTQLWRTTWLVGVLGGCGLALCTGILWRDGARSRIVLALLGLVWFFQPTPGMTAAIAGLAVALEFGKFDSRLSLSDGHAVVALWIAAILSMTWAVAPIVGYVHFLHGLQAGEAASTLDPLRNRLQSLPLCAVVAAWFVAPAAAAESAVVALAMPFVCIALLAAGAVEWDQRTVAQAYLEQPEAPAGLVALAAGQRQEVLWVGSQAEAWFALQRPQYFSPQQGASIVFSRPLAREWARRADVLVKLGLVQKNVYSPWKLAADDDHEKVTQVAIDTLCARPDAPGLVVFPHNPGEPGLKGMVFWPLPAPLFSVRDFVSGSESERIEGYGIVSCAAAKVLPR